jgi:hypothetical protein
LAKAVGKAVDRPGTKSGTNTDKENLKQAAAAPRRQPCNCKKSRCLKLYCECFSAEVFCEGCNCSDCYNNGKNHEVRDKAMKETRAKNPKAFQPRFNVVSSDPAQTNHSMGCRCKKSECLKKYCEVRFVEGFFCKSISSSFLHIFCFLLSASKLVYSALGSANARAARILQDLRN